MPAGYTVSMDTKGKLLQPERLAEIRKLLDEYTTVKVAEVSTRLRVSENTVRRDFIALERQGLCRRTKGGATRSLDYQHASPFTRRHNQYHSDKRSIALRAAELVHSGSTIIIDSGTTAAELALQIAAKRHITVITPSLAVANVLADMPEITLLLPGGMMNTSSRSLTGSPAEDFFSSIHADILFLAVKAVSAKGGLADHNIAETAVKRSMIACSDRVVVLADHSKIGRSALSNIAEIRQADTIVTDARADQKELEAITRLGLTVLTADKDN